MTTHAREIRGVYACLGDLTTAATKEIRATTSVSVVAGRLTRPKLVICSTVKVVVLTMKMAWLRILMVQSHRALKALGTVTTTQSFRRWVLLLAGSKRSVPKLVVAQRRLAAVDGCVQRIRLLLLPSEEAIKVDATWRAIVRRATRSAPENGMTHHFVPPVKPLSQSCRSKPASCARKSAVVQHVAKQR